MSSEANAGRARTRRTKKATAADPAVPPLSADAMDELRKFARYALGEGHLTAWEENFVNHLKHKGFRPIAWLSEKEIVKYEEVKAKLHYGKPDVPLPEIDPDGMEVNDDPDGWPIEREEIVDDFDDGLLMATRRDG